MKNIIITGASGGIGSAISKSLAIQENKLLLVYNQNKNEIENLSIELEGKCEFEIFQCDLTNFSQVEKLVQSIISKYQHIDGLVNCAGVSLSKQIQDITQDDYQFVMDNNFKSCALITKFVSKNMIANQNGKIVNISSIWGTIGASMESLYSASKGAINTFTLALAKELGPSNITVNSVCPGLIDTKMNSCYSPTEIQEIIEDTPIKRIGKPQDVASLVKFLLSDEADFITGQIITVDGGLSL